MFALTLMIISAVVGAGFATGAELIAFFGASTLPPIAIAVLVGASLFCLMAIIVFLPSEFKKIFFTPIYFIFFIAMTAGVSELLGPFAAAIAVIISVLIVWFGFEKMLFANKILMAFALAVLLYVVVIHLGESLPKTNLQPNVLSTASNALLYAGLNCCLLPAVFSEAKKKFTYKDLMTSVFTAAITVSFFVLILLTVIRSSGVGNEVIPVLALSDNFVLVIAIFICILTSMFATLFGLEAGSDKNGIVKLSVIGVIGYAFSFLGFTKVVGIFYPIVGAFMVVYTMWLFTAYCIKHFHNKCI